MFKSIKSLIECIISYRFIMQQAFFYFNELRCIRNADCDINKSSMATDFEAIF